MAVDDARSQREAKLQGLNQDVLAVKTQPVPALPPGGKRAPDSHRDAAVRRRLPLIALMALVLATAGVLIASYAVWLLQQQQSDVHLVSAQAAAINLRLSEQDARLSSLVQQVVEARQQLESLLTAPPVAPVASGNAAAANAQVNARLRKLDMELEQVTGQLKQAHVALSQLQQFRQQTGQQLAGQGDKLAGVSHQIEETRQMIDGMDQKEALKDLQVRLDRATTDIRSLYRMLELGR